jgi:hypothetical protein
MAKAAVGTKIPQDIEYRVIGNAFGLLIASGGLLAGAMVSQRSFQYWQEDIVPLGLLVFMGYRLFTGLVSTMTAYQDAPHHPRKSSPTQNEKVRPDPAVMAKLSAPNPTFTTEQVVDEVVKRIEAQKAEQAKKKNPK